MLSIDWRVRQTNRFLTHTPDLQWILGFWGVTILIKIKIRVWRITIVFLEVNRLESVHGCPSLVHLDASEFTGLLASRSPGAFIRLGASARVAQAQRSVHGRACLGPVPPLAEAYIQPAATKLRVASSTKSTCPNGVGWTVSAKR